MKKHRIALIGGGHRGIFLAKLMTVEQSRAMLVAIAEPREDRREDCRRAFDLPSNAFFHDHNDLLAHLDKVDVDAVIIATNVATHAEIVLSCLEAKILMFVEKPMAATIEQAQRIVEAAQKARVPIQVGFNLRYAPFFMKMHELISSGEIGEVISVEWAEVIGARHWADGYCRNPSYGFRASVGSWLLEKSCHDMDQLAWLIGSKCKRVASFGGRTYFLPREGLPKRCGEECHLYVRCPWKADPTGGGMASWLLPEEREVCVFHTGSDIVDHQNAILEFENGVLASFNLNPFGVPERRYFTIYGVEGLIYGDTSINRIHLRKQGSGVEVIYNITAGEQDHGGADAHIAKAFLDFLDDPGRNQPKTGILEGFEAVLMACAIDIAREENRVVELDEYRRGILNE